MGSKQLEAAKLLCVLLCNSRREWQDSSPGARCDPSVLGPAKLRPRHLPGFTAVLYEVGAGPQKNLYARLSALNCITVQAFVHPAHLGQGGFGKFRQIVAHVVALAPWAQRAALQRNAVKAMADV